MRTAALTSALLSLILLGTSCRGVAMDAQQAFPQDPRAAELAHAAAEGDAAQVRALVQSGANPNAQGDRGVNVLQFAMAGKHADALDALLTAGADPNAPGLGGATAMHIAAMADDPSLLRVLLDHGGDPNARHGMTRATPLMAAAGPRTDAQFRMLLDKGSDPNLADRTGNTALHSAAMLNAGAQVLLLLERGADPNAKNAQDATFQPYFFRTPDSVLNADAKASRKAVIAWLQQHNVPLEAAATP